MREKEALIVITRNFDGISRLARPLSLAGCRVDVLTPPGATLASSSFVSETFPGSFDADDALNRLRRVLDGKSRDWVIFGDEIVLDRAVERRSEPWLGRLLPVRGAGADDAAKTLISKSAFSLAMGAAGIAMAPAREASSPERIRGAARELGLPVIVKPDRGFAGSGIFSARSFEQLERGLERAKGEFLVERLIEGRVGATPVLFLEGRPVWWSSFFKDGVWPPPYGGSCRRLPFEPDGLEPILRRMGEALGLHGLFGVDWMLTPHGELFVIELNGRPIPMVQSDPHTSEVFPVAVRDFLAGREVVRRPPPVHSSGVLHAMPASFLLAFSERRWRDAAGLLFGLSGRTDTPWEDSGLLRKHVSRMAKTMIRLSYESLPSPLRRQLSPVASAAVGSWRRGKYS